MVKLIGQRPRQMIQMKDSDKHDDGGERLKKAFEETVGRYDGVIRKVCYFYSSDIDDFNDLRQEALINLWRGFPRFRGEANLSTWIYRVTLNSCVSAFRKKRKRADTLSLDQCRGLLEEPDQKAGMLREMYRMINRLGPSDKALILLWLDEHTYEEMASVMGIPRNTIASRLRRAKEKLVSLTPHQP